MKHPLLIALLILGIAVPPAYAQRRNSRNEGRVSLDFHDVEIADVVKAISEITGKNFMLDDRVRGKITVMSPSPVSVDEAYQVFLSALQMKNLCAVDTGVVTKIVPSRECKENDIPLETDNEKAFGDQPITKLIPLKFINANEIKQALNPLVSKTGTIVAYGPTNTLMITDQAANVRRLQKIIEKLDRQNFQASVEVVPLKFATANDMADKLTQILEKEKGGTTRFRRGADVEGGSDVSKIIPDVRTNSLIVVANRDGLGRVLDLLAELDRAVEMKSDQNWVHVRRLEHSDATELAQILSSLISGTTPARKKDQKTAAKNMNQVSPGGAEPLPWEEDMGSASPPPLAAEGGSIVRRTGGMFQDEVRIVADPSTNALVVTASPADYASLTPIIDELDRRKSQVFVETLIMEVTLSKEIAVGVSGHGGAKPNGSVTAFGSSQFGPLNLAAISQPANTASAMAGATGLVLGGMSNQQFKLGGITIPMSGAMFRAMQTNNTINVLSAPNLLTTDNKKAEIVVGDKVPFLVSSAVSGGNVSQNQYQREQVGIKLFVTPHISDGTQVTMDIEQYIEEVRQYKGAGDIGNSERSIKTTVIADNGQTIVLGGLIQDRETKNVSKVPLLGDIPLVGYLFRNNEYKKEKINLIVFMTPHVIHDQNDLTRISVKKNNERRKFNKKQGIGENKALYDYDLDKGLNMAAPPEKKSRQEIKTKKRFNYDEAPPAEEQGSDEDSQISRRQPRRSEPKSSFADQGTADDSADVQIRRPRARPAPGGSANPFSDVRPPSSR